MSYETGIFKYLLKLKDSTAEANSEHPIEMNIQVLYKSVYIFMQSHGQATIRHFIRRLSAPSFSCITLVTARGKLSMSAQHCLHQLSVAGSLSLTTASYFSDYFPPPHLSFIDSRQYVNLLQVMCLSSFVGLEVCPLALVDGSSAAILSSSVLWSTCFYQSTITK